MKTFFSWLIANTETITNILVVIAFEIAAICGWLTTPDSGLAMFMLLGPLLVLFAKSLLGSYPSKSTGNDFCNLILFVTGTIFIFVLGGALESPAKMTLMVTTILIALAVAVIATVFTFNNIDIVASRRMFYRNSNVDMFSYSLKYSFNRFVSVFTSLANTVYLFAFGPAFWESLIQMK